MNSAKVNEEEMLEGHHASVKTCRKVGRKCGYIAVATVNQRSGVNVVATSQWEVTT